MLPSVCTVSSLLFCVWCFIFANANFGFFMISFCDITLCFTPCIFSTVYVALSISDSQFTEQWNSWINLLEFVLRLQHLHRCVFLLADDDGSEGRTMLKKQYDGKCSLFYVELPGGTILYHSVGENEKFPIQFGREVDTHALIGISAPWQIVFIFVGRGWDN